MLMLIIRESYIGAFLLILLLQFYPCYYTALLFYSCTCWVPTISVLNLVIFYCYSNLLLRMRGWTEILRLGVLGYVLPRLSFLWCYGVFRCSVPLRVVIVFRDIIYVIIIILYSWYLIICEHFWLYVWNNWSWIMHMMSTWFWHKNQVWHLFNSSRQRERDRVLRWVWGTREPVSGDGPTEWSNGSEPRRAAVGGPMDPSRSPLVANPVVATRWAPTPLHLGLRFRPFLLFDYYSSYLDLKRKLHLLLNVASMRLNLGTGSGVPVATNPKQGEP
jgi:hypothetical protein